MKKKAICSPKFGERGLESVNFVGQGKPGKSQSAINIRHFFSQVTCYSLCFIEKIT